MKLIDILVEENIENGWSWPERANCITQDSDREIIPATCQPCVAKFDASFNRWFLNGSRIGGFIADILASDYETATITREQYEAALAAKNGGWIEWGGGECPVEKGTLVDVRYRNGEENHHVGAGLSFCDTGSNPDLCAEDWSKDDTSSDIIAYRLHQPQEVAQIEAEQEADMNECIGQAPAPVWNGEGLPPVGCECEYSLNGGSTWWKCKIDYIVGTQGVVMLCDTFEGVQYVQFSSYGDALKFRPIRSEADIKRHDAAQALCYAGGGIGKVDESAGIGSCWFDVYDAIAAGKIPGVKLDD